MNKRLRKKKGFAKIEEKELWGLDVTLAKYILPRLIAFKKIQTMSHPTECSSLEEWHSILDKMIYSFNYVLEEDFSPRFSEDIAKARKDKYEEGMQLFAKYYLCLWD